MKNNYFLMGLSSTLVLAFSLASVETATAQETSTCKSEYFLLPTNGPYEPMQICATSQFNIGFDDGITIQLPEPGEQTIITVLQIDGSEVSHSVSLSSDYLLKVDSSDTVDFLQRAEGDQSLLTRLISDGGGSAGITDTGCLYGSFVDSQVKWNKRFDWFYDPRGESSDMALSRIQDAISLWQYPVNRCTGESFSTNFKAQFMGSSTAKTSKVSNPGCSGPSDNVNLVSWKSLGYNGVLGVTCRGVNSTTKFWTEADVVLNSSYTEYFYDFQDPKMCPSPEIFLVNVAAHEFGHAIGLEHVPFQMHQIMSERTNDCVREKTGLAPGDYSGIMQIYGLDHSNVAI